MRNQQVSPTASHRASMRLAGVSALALAMVGWTNARAVDITEDAGAREPYEIHGSDVAASDPNNFTDYRLGYHLLPSDGYSFSSLGTAREGDFDDASRVSLMVFGPVCSVIPINCFTPARIERDKDLPNTIDWGQQEGWNFMGGFELSASSFQEDGVNSFAASIPQIDYDAYALTLHVLGLGTEYKCFGNCRFQIEANPFLGVGWGQVNIQDLTLGLDEDRDGVYYEVGARFGMFFTLPFGLQIGGETRWLWSDTSLSNDSILEGVDFNVKGFSVGGSVGYRW